MTESHKDYSDHLDFKDRETLEEYLANFTQFVDAQEQSDGTQPIIQDQWLWSYEGGKSSFHLVVSVMIHGNEIGPLEGLLDVMDALNSGKIKYDGRLSCFIGNPKAARLNQRFLDIDLNRVFDSNLLQNEINKLENVDEPTKIPHEIQRAQNLLPILDQADLYIDFHQTILESSQPFYICPFSEEAWHWARILGGAKAWVTRHPAQLSGGLKCADEYVRQKGKAALALELGKAGFSAKARAGVWKSLNRALSAINQLSQDSQASQNLLLESLAQTEPELEFYQTSFRCEFKQADFKLKAGLINFQSVQEHEQLSEEDSPLLLAQEAGALLFPKYPARDDNGLAIEPKPKELYRMVSLLSSHPKEIWPDLFESEEPNKNKG